METNLSVWDYYPKNDKPFIDPLYVPYQKTYITTENNLGDEVKCPVNTWSLSQGMCEGNVNPALIRRGWGQTFQLMFPDKDPCPAGYTKSTDGEGWCTPQAPEYGDHGLYSKDAFVPMYQYFSGYASTTRRDEINEFSPVSINPHTGNFVVYIKPYISPTTNKYLFIPSRDSYLA